MCVHFELILALLLIALLTGCAAQEPAMELTDIIIGDLTLEECIADRAPLEHVKAQLDKLAPVELASDIDALPVTEQRVLHLLVDAARCMDEAFTRQVFEWNYCIYLALRESDKPEDKPYLEFMDVMFGPWDRLDEDKPFIGLGEKPEGANYYPMDMTAEEFNAYLDKHPDQRKAFESSFTMIRRSGGKLVAIPYSEFFVDNLRPAAEYLKEAARTTQDPTLATFLNSRADAFLSDDYYQSDMDWMDLAGDIEVVIGPYEVYEDGLFGYKAAFESFVCVVDHAESKKLGAIGKHLNAMEEHLPNPKEHKNFDRGASSPIKVVNEIFAGGDTKAGIQTIAFNLPNDERVREAKGSKKVMLKNLLNAKFDKILKPIAEEVLTETTLKQVSFDGYFNHVLLHEVSHGLGPGKITLKGKETSVNKELKDLYSVIEECKADTLGIYNTQFLIDEGVLPKALEESLYASYLAGMFRSIRFGINEAHGGGIAIQLNWHLANGGFGVDSKGLFYVNQDKIKESLRSLARELLVLQAEGDYAGCGKLIEKYKKIGPETEAALAKLSHLPVDIRPIYPIEQDV